MTDLLGGSKSVAPAYNRRTMTGPPAYFDLIRQMHNRFDYRLRLVQTARQQGIQATARLFQTTVPTVRKGLRRYQQHRLSGLREQSRTPHQRPRKTPPEIERQVLQLRRQLPTFGAARLQREFDLAVSHKAIQRIWRAHGLIRKRRRKDPRQQDLAAVKATGRLFQQISADTKYLDDIPRYWPQAQRLRLPLIQYTAREVRSGLLFLAFASRRSASASAVFADRIQRHLDRCGIDLPHLVFQTDHGGEFVGALYPDGSRDGFPRAIRFFGSPHQRPPPPPTPIRAMSKPCTASSKTSSSPRLPVTSSTATSPDPTPIRDTAAPGRSSSGSLPAGILLASAHQLRLLPHSKRGI